MTEDDTWTPEQLKAERAAVRGRVLEGLGIVMVVLVLVGLLLTATGCASERFLTEEQDARLREQCVQGCLIVPAPLWREIEQLLRNLLQRPTEQS